MSNKNNAYNFDSNWNFDGWKQLQNLGVISAGRACGQISELRYTAWVLRPYNIALKSGHIHHCTDDTQKVETVVQSAVVLLLLITKSFWNLNLK